MIPGIFLAKANIEIAGGADKATALLKSRRLSGGLIGIAGAIGALGGVGINLAFRQSFAAAKSGTPAVVGFLAFYAVCFLVTWAVYLRPAAATSPRAALATVRI
jgi:NNP family nitrate/nitrite transporter-like MFS transporter